MKKIILILMLIIASTIVSAYSYSGNIEVYSFKVYVDGKSQSMDWDDDDRILAYAGSIMEIQIRYENDYDSSVINGESIDVKTTGTLLDVGADIEREKTIDIDNKGKKTVVLEFYIPTNVNEETYEMEIEYEYYYYKNRTNTTPEKHNKKESKTFDVDIRKKTTDMEEIWINISQSLSYEKARNNDLLETVIDMTDIARNYSTCSLELGELRNKDILYVEYKGKYDTAVKEKGDEHDKLTRCTEEKKNMFSATQLNNEITNKVKAGKREQKKADDNMMIGLGVAAITYFVMKKRKETVGGKGEGEPLTGGW